MTSHAETFRTVSRFKTDSRSPAVHLPFERTGMPFKCLVLSVLKNSSSVRTVRAIRSRKLISRSNGSSYPFEKNHRLFERLELSVREIHQPFEWLKLSVREFISRSNGSSYPFEKFISRSNGSSYPFEKFISRSNGSSYPFEKFISSAVRTAWAVRARKKQLVFFGSRSNKTRLQNKSPCFFKWWMPLWLHCTNSRHVSVLCLSSFNFK